MNTNAQMTALRRFGQAFAALAVAAGLGAFAPAAHAQSGSLSLGNGGSASNCATFTGFAWSNGTLTVNCVPTQVVQTCDTAAATTGFHVSSPASVNSFVNSTVTITVTRDGGCAGSYTVNFGSGGFADPAQPGSMATGWSALPASSLTFNAGDTSKTITVSTGTTPGLIGIWMTGGGTVAVTGSTAIYVAPAPPAGGGGGGNASCGSANWVFDMSNNNQVVFGSNEPGSNPALMPGQTVALGFTFNPATGGGGMLQLSPVISSTYGQPAVDTEISIATCAGVFQTGAANTATNTPSNSLVSSDHCDVRVPASTYAGQGITAITAAIPSIAGNYCHLTQGQKYYINIRQVPAQNFTSTTSSCQDTSHGCTLRVQPQGLN